MILAATSYRAVGAVIGLLIVFGGIAYLVYNWLSARDEIGSEIELAANRKPYYDDEDLEGKKLDGALSAALFLLAVSAVGLPLYWLAEPGRQEGALAQYDVVFTDRGTGLYEELCSSCHGGGGAGGAAQNFVITEDGKFQDQVNWLAPELTTVLLRFSEDEVREILNLGRPPTPMPAWGAPGGGPLTEQQIDELIFYMRSITIDPEEARQRASDELAAVFAEETVDPISGESTPVESVIADSQGWETPGEALFNSGLTTSFAQGAYSCGRCHTNRWSYAGRSAIAGPDGVEDSPDDDTPFNALTAEPGATGGGALGPALWNVTSQFSDSVGPNLRPLNLAWGEVELESDSVAATTATMPLELENGALMTVLIDAPVEWAEPTEDELAEAAAAAEAASEGGGDPDAPPPTLPAPGWRLALYDNGEVIEVDDRGRPLDLDGEVMEFTSADRDDLDPATASGELYIVEAAVIGADGDLLADDDGDLAEVPEHRPFSADQIDFITNGGEEGRPYGNNGNGAWQMPGFGQMMTQSQIAAIVEFERGLDGDDRQEVTP